VLLMRVLDDAWIRIAAGLERCRVHAPVMHGFASRRDRRGAQERLGQRPELWRWRQISTPA
jgi:hypothetical protein